MKSTKRACRAALAALALCGLGMPSWAINKCINEWGRPVFQDAPCPGGRGGEIEVRPASGAAKKADAPKAVGAGGAAASAAAAASAPMTEAQRIEAQIAQSQRERRLRDLQERAQQDALASANKALESVLTRWDDALRVANSTSRVNLATPVATLQAVRRDAEALTLSPCMDPAKEALVASMQHTIDGFIIWWRNDLKMGNDLAKPDFEAAGKKMDEFKSLRGLCAR